MSGKVFDKNYDALPDLELKVDPSRMVEPKTPVEEKDPGKVLKQHTASQIFVMRQKEKTEETLRKSEGTGIQEEKDLTNIKTEIEPEPVLTNRGKRGVDKKPRKKREMTEKQRETLRLAREKSVAVRRAKKEAKLAAMPSPVEPKPEPKLQNAPVTAPVTAPMAFDHFCSLMDRYEDRKKKRHSTSKEPHPNKIIEHQHKPRPPVQKVERAPQQPSMMDAYNILRQGGRNSSLFGAAFNNF